MIAKGTYAVSRETLMGVSLLPRERLRPALHCDAHITPMDVLRIENFRNVFFDLLDYLFQLLFQLLLSQTGQSVREDQSSARFVCVDAPARWRERSCSRSASASNRSPPLASGSPLVIGPVPGNQYYAIHRSMIRGKLRSLNDRVISVLKCLRQCDHIFQKQR